MKKSTERKALLALAISFSLILLFGCSTFKQTNTFPGTPYCVKGFQTKEIRLGFVTPSSAQGLEQDKWILLKILSDTIKKRNSITVISPNECLSLINRTNLAKQYTKMIQDYKVSGILEKEVLSKLGKVIHADYFLHLSLTGFEQSVHTRFSVFSLRLINSQEAKMRASIKIWSKDGNIVWESQAENIISVETFKAKPIAFKKIAQMISRKLVSRLP